MTDPASSVFMWCGGDVGVLGGLLERVATSIQSGRRRNWRTRPTNWNAVLKSTRWTPRLRRCRPLPGYGMRQGHAV